MASATGWLLDIGDGVRAAIGAQEMIHLVELPELWEIPGAPAYCREILVWQSEILPVMNLGCRLTASPLTRNPRSFAAIVAYHRTRGQSPGFGALLLQDIPSRVLVDDEQGCPLPEQPGQWNALAKSCFADDEGRIPILDLTRIFAAIH